MSESLSMGHVKLSLANDRQPVLKVTNFSHDRVAFLYQTWGKSAKTAFWLKGAFGLKAQRLCDGWVPYKRSPLYFKITLLVRFVQLHKC